MNIDPWGSGEKIDNEKLFSEFGMSRLDSATLGKIDFLLARRGGVSAHRDLGKWLLAAESGKPVAAMSGIKPSSEFHLGSKMTADELIFYQKKYKAKVFYAIADLESFADNGLSLSETRKTAISNVADLLALGLDHRNAHIYKQSREMRVMNHAYLLSKRATHAMLRAIYGERDLSLYLAALVQVGDILLPQHEDFGGPKHVLVPVGIDQDPHIRLTRDLAFKEKLVLPSSTYHITIRNLKGEAKMSKRDPSTMLSLADAPKVAEKKLMSAFTGGRATAEEQKRLGGSIENDVLYELMRVHFCESDSLLSEMRADMETGRLLTGEYKKKYVPHILGWLKAHQEKKASLMHVAEEILKE